MNEPARIDALLRQARVHEAPPDLWAKIAARARPTRGGGWRSAAALLLGAFAYAMLATAWRPSGAPHDDVTRAVITAWPYLSGADHEAAADPLLLQRLAQAATREAR